MFTEVVNGLRTVMGHLIQVKLSYYSTTYILTYITQLYSQDIIQRKDQPWDPTLNTKLFDYLKSFFKKDHQVFDEIGIQR